MGERRPETVGVGRPSEHYDADEGDKPSNMENHKTPFEIGIFAVTASLLASTDLEKGCFNQ
jgi:hypothetical protein